jgi:hypothetical protein
MSAVRVIRTIGTNNKILVEKIVFTNEEAAVRLLLL